MSTAQWRYQEPLSDAIFESSLNAILTLKSYSHEKIILSGLVLFLLNSIENDTQAQVAFSSKNFELSGVLGSNKPAASGEIMEK